MHDYSEPSFPLERAAFTSALHAGRGRARMHLDAYDVRDYQDVVHAAATTCHVYDPQVEGLPSAWFVPFCEGAEVVSPLISQVPSGSHWDKVWHCRLLFEFAQRGYEGARKALYRACDATEYGGLFGAEDIVVLDGADGLVFVARKLGQLLMSEPSRTLDESAVNEYDTQFGEGAAVTVLGALSVTDAAIAAYLKHLLETTNERASSPARRRRSVDATVRKVLAAKTSQLGLSYWARDCTEAELEPLFRIALSDVEPIVIENALRCLSGARTLPLRPDLLPLVRHPDRSVRTFAARVLGRHVDLRVREAGLSVLAQDIATALELLRVNATAEDATTIIASLLPIPDAADQHGVAFDVVQMLDRCPDLRQPSLALYVYEHSPCQNCRGSAVQHLVASNACPPWVLSEGRFDASERVRELVGQTA